VRVPIGMAGRLWLIFIIPLAVGCNLFQEEKSDVHSIASVDTTVTVNTIPEAVLVPGDSITPLELRLIEAGLVEVRSLDSTIAVDLKYTTTDNFLNADVYGDFNNCYLQPDVAEKLIVAQRLLRGKFPAYRLVVFDAVRPRSVQQKMWDILDVPVRKKVQFVSNPKLGSLHNFGAAVDVSILDEYGEELDMATPFDHFGELAWPTKEKELLAEGVLTEQQVQNRKLLR